jgi:hypothetical protein
MGTIYRQATTVVIWLGEAWPDLDLAWNFFTVLGTDLGIHSNPALTPSLAEKGVDVE